MASAEIPKRIIESHTIYSAHLSEERNIKVFLPPQFNPADHYPVLYCHDGNEFLTHGRIATIANQIIFEGRLRPIIIVLIAVSHAHRMDDYALYGARNDAYISFVLDECLPFVENHYPVATDLSGRFMAGISLGGVVSLEIYIRRPDLFSNLLLFSGAYYQNVKNRVEKLSEANDLDAFMVVGKQERVVKTDHGVYDFYTANRIVRDLLVTRGAKIEYKEADGQHVWGFWQSQLPDALNWLTQRM